MNILNEGRHHTVYTYGTDWVLKLPKPWNPIRKKEIAQRSVDFFNHHFSDFVPKNTYIEKWEGTPYAILQSRVHNAIHLWEYLCQTNNPNPRVLELLEEFEDIVNKYETYSDFKNEEDWAEAYNDVYTFVNIENSYEVGCNFDDELRDSFLRDLKSTVDLGDLEDRMYDMSIGQILDELEEIGLLSNLPFSIAFYFDWKSTVKRLRGNGITIDKLNDLIIVEM